MIILFPKELFIEENHIYWKGIWIPVEELYKNFLEVHTDILEVFM